MAIQILQSVPASVALSFHLLCGDFKSQHTDTCARICPVSFSSYVNIVSFLANEAQCIRTP